MNTRAILAIGITLAATLVQAVDVEAQIRKKDGGVVRGITRWQPAQKQYLVDVKVGSGTSQMPVPAADVAEIRVATPPRLREAIQQKNTAILESIMRDYVMLQYDEVAGRALARIYLDQNRAADALRVCKAVLNTNPNAIRSDLAPYYWKALLANGQGADLAPVLDEAIRTGAPSIAAGALIVRGDLLRAEGKRREALADGYLRVVTLYRQQRDLQPEALLKAAQTFEELQQTTYADKMRQELLTRYPDSEEARASH